MSRIATTCDVIWEIYSALAIQTSLASYCFRDYYLLLLATKLLTKMLYYSYMPRFAKLNDRTYERLRIGSAARRMSIADYLDVLLKDKDWAEIDAIRHSAKRQEKEKVA